VLVPLSSCPASCEIVKTHFAPLPRAQNCVGQVLKLATWLRKHQDESLPDGGEYMMPPHAESDTFLAWTARMHIYSAMLCRAFVQGRGSSWSAFSSITKLR
jgi:hypothetical protein